MLGRLLQVSPGSDTRCHGAKDPSPGKGPKGLTDEEVFCRENAMFFLFLMEKGLSYLHLFTIFTVQNEGRWFLFGWLGDLSCLCRFLSLVDLRLFSHIVCWGIAVVGQLKFSVYVFLMNSNSDVVEAVSLHWYTLPIQTVSAQGMWLQAFHYTSLAATSWPQRVSRSSALRRWPSESQWWMLETGGMSKAPMKGTKL